MEFEVLKRVMVEVLNVDESEIALTGSFVDDFGADSLDLYQIVSGVEEKLNIEIKPYEAEKIKTVGEAVKLLEKKCS